MELKNCRITDDYVFFWGSEFSNWHPCIFMYNGERFNNTEQAFMWDKAKFFGDDYAAEKLLKETNPKYAKSIGRKVMGFNEEQWMINSFSFMFAVNFAKFSQNEDLKQLLLSTEDRELVEASPYDKIWGIGIAKENDDCLDKHKWNGMNLLGRVLVLVRKTIKEKQS